MENRSHLSKRLSIETLLALPNAEPPLILHKYSDGEDLVSVQANTFNIVLSRDVRKNVRASARMALSMAREHPMLDVWYVNTYAQPETLKAAFEAEIAAANITPPPDEEPEPLPEGWTEEDERRWQ